MRDGGLLSGVGTPHSTALPLQQKGSVIFLELLGTSSRRAAFADDITRFATFLLRKKESERLDVRVPCIA